MSLYRNSVWFLKGMKEYTRNGYDKASKNFNTSDLEVDCSGRHYLITGSNSGIGQCIATAVAARGGAVHLVCRNADAAHAAKEEIVAQTGNQKITVHQLDLSDTAAIFRFAEKFKEDPGQLDVLVNNAGCMVNTRTLTADNKLELNFATNTLGTYCITTALLHLLHKSGDGRVVTVSSGGMLTCKLSHDDLQSERGKFDGTLVYARNKRQQVVMTRQWACQRPCVHFSTMHPGWADTPAVRSSMPQFYEKMKNRLRTAEQGADTAVWLAVAEAARQQPSGLFFQDRCPVSEHLPLASTSSNPQDEAELMTQLEKLAQHYRPAA